MAELILIFNVPSVNLVFATHPDVCPVALSSSNDPTQSSSSVRTHGVSWVAVGASDDWPKTELRASFRPSGTAPTKKASRKLGQKFERFASRVLFDSFEFMAIVGLRVYGRRKSGGSRWRGAALSSESSRSWPGRRQQ